MRILSVKKNFCFHSKIRFHWQALIVYENGENLKILIEIFRQKVILSDIERPPFSKSLDPPLKLSK